MMHFQHHTDIWREFPELTPGVLTVSGIAPDGEISAPIDRFHAIARARLKGREVSEFPEIQAWRRAFSRMGLKPTQYRSASEALLRRFSKEGDLPLVLPPIDLCNAVSLAFAIPIAVLDRDAIEGNLEVRPATGAEVSLAFSGELEHPAPGEVIFADDANRVHARRWCNRQTRHSAVQSTTTNLLIVAEAMHEHGREDMERLLAALTASFGAFGGVISAPAILTVDAPRYDLPPIR